MLEYLRSFAYIEAIETTGSIRKAAQALYINWHVALTGAPHAVAEYGMAIDLGDSGYVYFIYNHIAAPDDVADAGYTIGLEDADGQPVKTELPID